MRESYFLLLFIGIFIGGSCKSYQQNLPPNPPVKVEFNEICNFEERSRVYVEGFLKQGGGCWDKMKNGTKIGSYCLANLFETEKYETSITVLTLKELQYALFRDNHDKPRRVKVVFEVGNHWFGGSCRQEEIEIADSITGERLYLFSADPDF